jgi:exopolyphosphatase/guanosine-5'-triphosphate,3'-diphosphate pyrophosphatase
MARTRKKPTPESPGTSRGEAAAAAEPRRLPSPIGEMSLPVAPLVPLGEGVEEPRPGRLAAIDIGSNSIHMIIVEADPAGGYRVLDREKEMVGLGRTLQMGEERARLPAEAVEIGFETLKRFLVLASLRGAAEAVAVATSAVREAIDREEFVARVEAQTGLEVRVLSGAEEGYLVYLAVREAVDLSEPRAVIADLGGGSTEWIRVEDGEMVGIESLALGSLRLGRLLPEAPPTDAELARLGKRIARGLENLPSAGPADRMIATSGTAVAVAGLSDLWSDRPWRAAPGALRILEAADVEKVVTRLSRLSRKEIASLPPVDAARASSILAGAILLRELLAASGSDRLAVCDRSLRDGLVLATLGRTPEPAGSSRRRQVERLARRVESVHAHSVQCARLAVRLFDVTMSIHGFGPREREWLEYAALLHDIGYSVHHRRHQDHSRYLIANSGLEGFDPGELRLIALTAGYHRGRRPRSSDPALAGLAPWERKVVKGLVALLRLADALDRTHASRVETLFCAIRKRRVRIDVISAFDVSLELETARKQKRLFERRWDVKVRLQQGLSPAP